ncbi:MAG TPA: hypothetical protein VN436_01315 [Holophaga sp.]|nr:hypothetical protein [Holophaga sp.]
MTRLRVLLPFLCCMAFLPAQEARAQMTDAQTEAFAHQALALQDPAAQKAAAEKLRAHRFRSLKTKEREFALYAEGMLEDRAGDTARAAVTLRKLEVSWPQSSYLPEALTILATQAVERRRFKEAETRLKKALDADIPVESKRRAQELLIWTLSEQGRLAEGIPIVKSLQPLGSAKPSERGLVAILQALCLAKEKDQADAVRKDLLRLYPTSRYMSRGDLAWGRLLGSMDDAPGAAELFRGIITRDAESAEADEARLALASLLSEGKLHPKEAEAYPAPQKLLADVRKNDRKGALAQRALLVELHMDMNQARWKEAFDVSAKLLGNGTDPEEEKVVRDLRTEAVKAWTQQLLDRKTLDPLLPYLDKETINLLTPGERAGLARLLTQQGLPDAAKAIVDAAPAEERQALLKAAAEQAGPGADPESTLQLLSSKGETPAQALVRGRALVALKRWREAKAALARALPGPDRISLLLACLRRPPEKGEGPGARLREAEGWLARVPEKGPDREPLVVLVADLRAQAGDWRKALALYPPDPQKGNRGWVALMRATCQLKLGQRDAAKATLKTALNEPDFKMERQTLAKPLGL